MKNLLLLSLGIMILFACTKEADETTPTNLTTDTICICKPLQITYDNSPVVGHISMTEYTYEYDSAFRQSYFSYASWGGFYGTLRFRTNYSYDSEGRVTDFELTGDGQTSPPLSLGHYTVTYASNGDTAQMKWNGIVYKEWNYNSDGHEIGHVFYQGQNPSQKLEWKNNTHDTSGNILTTDFFFDGVFQNTETYTYNKFNKPLTKSSSSMQHDYWIKEYDDHGREIGHQWNKYTKRINFQHDEYGNTTYYEVYGDSILRERHTFTYQCEEKIIQL